MSTIPPTRQTSYDPLWRFPEGIKRLVLEKSLVKDYPAGELVVGPGNRGDHVTFLLGGRASLVLQDNQEKMTVDELFPGDIFGEVSFFTGGSWPSDSLVMADEPCQVLEIPAEDFELMLRQEPDFVLPLVRGLGRKIIRLHRTIFESRTKRRALQDMISRQEHIFPDYYMGHYMRRRVSDRVAELAQSDCPVLLVGESGVGKEGIAHALFQMSHHGKEVFMQVDLMGTDNDGDRPEDLSGRPDGDKELTEKQNRLFFGAEEPGPDGGAREKPGYFDLTEGGTLLVRGVEKLTRVIQLRLLEALATGSFRRHGGVRARKGKVRLIATTRLNPARIEPQDHPLIHALMNWSIVIPPLRTRRREIPGLVQHYLKKYGQERHKQVDRLPKETLKMLVNYQWPGNDQELATTLKRALLVSQGGVIRPEDIYFDLRRIERDGKFNLLRYGPVKQALTSPLYPAVVQSAITPFFFIILAILFLGPSDPMKNPASLSSWALGWPLLILGAFLGARSWCAFCPIGTVGSLAKNVMALEKPFPEFLKIHSDFVIAGVVLFIIWFETATNIRESPFVLGLLLVAMLLSAVAVATIYERRSWCLYMCGLGGMMGVWAKTSIIELRADRNVCISQCSSNACYVGTESQEGCPFNNAGPRLHSNRLCNLCAKCVKNCPHGAMTLSLRMPGREIWESRRPKSGTAFLVLGLLGGLISELLSKLPMGVQLKALLPFSETARFTIIFFGLILVVNVCFALAVTISRRIMAEDFYDNYARYGLALLPLALTGYFAFHIYYLVKIGVQLPALVREKLDFALFGRFMVTVPDQYIHIAQVSIILAGLAWTLGVIWRIARTDRKDMSVARAGAAPHAAIAILVGFVLIGSIRAYFYHG